MKKDSKTVSPKLYAIKREQQAEREEKKSVKKTEPKLRLADGVKKKIDFKLQFMKNDGIFPLRISANTHQQIVFSPSYIIEKN